jgi:hypothetical protein
VDAHVKAGEGIVAAVDSLNNLMGGCLTVFFVGQRVYIGSETGRGGGIDTSDMVVNSCLE